MEEYNLPAHTKSTRSIFPHMMLLALGVTAANFSSGATVAPGQTATVGPATPIEAWTLTNATLNVLPGGQTLNIDANAESTLTINGATVGGVRQVAGTATIVGSTLTNATGVGMSVVKATVSSPNGSATITDSVINGFGRGLNVTGGNSITVTNTQVTGSGVGSTIADNGYGLVLIGGLATFQSGSSITGSNRGILMLNEGTSSPTPSLVLDNTTVTGTAGSAIFVDTLGAAATPSIIVRNGSVLSGGNGVLLQVGESTGTPGNLVTLDFTVDGSTLTGDVQVFNSNIANIDLNNNTSFTGNMTDITSLDMNASTMTGNLSVPVGSAVAVTMAANSAFSGTMSNIGSLTLDASTMTGNVIQGSGSAASVALTNNSSLTGSLTNIGALTLDNSTLTGDVVQDNSTPASLALTNNSFITGTVTNAQSMTLDGTSTFNMVNDSSVGNLALNGGTVNLRGGGFRTLTASSLTGAGIFALGTDLAGHLSDFVNITGSASGTYTLAIQNTGVDPVQENHAQQVVHTGSGNASFAVQGGQVDVGTFVYQLEQRGTDWYLVQPGSNPVDPGGPIITPSARAVIGVFSAAPTVWYGELSTLRSRMGELRNGHEQGGLWTRAYGNKYQVSSADQVDYSQVQSGVSFGADTPISSQDGQWLIGVMGGYSHSDLDLRLGTDGTVDSYYLGLYSTWISNSGYYVDALIKANRFQNRADVRMSDGAKAEGDYDNYGVGGSVEVGKNIKLADNWFVEPYAQVSALWVKGEDYGLDNGMEASSNHADSLVGKIGSYIGRTFPLGRGGFVQPYVKVAGVQEFARNNEVKVNRTTFTNDLSGTRGELGAGVVAQLTDVLQMHADLDYSNGDKIEQPWGVNIGLRYAW